MAYRHGIKRLRSADLEEPIINLTPLIDVVFVVLIMFMIIAPMLEIDHVQLAPGRAKNPVGLLKETQALTIHVRKDNSIWLNKHEVTLKELSMRLMDAHRKNAQQKPQLFHDEKAYFGTYQSVKNAVEAAGFHEMDLVLKPS